MLTPRYGIVKDLVYSIAKSLCSLFIFIPQMCLSRQNNKVTLLLIYMHNNDLFNIYNYFQYIYLLLLLLF